MMTPEETIEALREWAAVEVTLNADDGEWWQGMAAARKHVRDIIDPPVPKWRVLVDEAASVESADPVPAVLRLIANLADQCATTEPDWLLARIVAICEAEVGDGWRADPDELHGYCYRDERRVQFLLYAVANFAPPHDWQVLANRAAAWLREIVTDGGGDE